MYYKLNFHQSISIVCNIVIEKLLYNNFLRKLTFKVFFKVEAIADLQIQWNLS